MKTFIHYLKIQHKNLLFKIYSVIFLLVTAFLFYASINLSHYFYYALISFLLIVIAVVYFHFDEFRYFDVNLPDGFHKRKAGSRVVHLNIKDGKRHGFYKDWHSNGNPFIETNYKNGKRHGVYKCWDSDGNSQEETNYKNGELDGFYKSWDSNGNPNIETNYVNGELDGFYKSWDYNGNPNIETNYVNGELDGFYKSWWSINGNPHIETNYKNGKRHGVYKEFHYKGKIIVESEYESGIEVARTEYYSNGSPRIVKKDDHYTFFSPLNKKVCEVYISIDNYSNPKGTFSPEFKGIWKNLNTWVNYKEDGISIDYELNFKNCKEGQAKKTIHTKNGKLNSLISYENHKFSHLDFHEYFIYSRYINKYSWSGLRLKGPPTSNRTNSFMKIENITGIDDILDITDDQK